MLAVTEPWVVRAALCYVLKAPPHCYWNVDVPRCPPSPSPAAPGGGDCGWRATRRADGPAITRMILSGRRRRCAPQR